MNIETMKRRSRVFAAGLCGAAVLAFAGLDVQQARAQDQPDDMQNDQAQDARVQDVENQDAQNQEAQTQNEQMKSTIDLSNVEFEAEVVKTIGDTALIVKTDEHELLLPTSVVSMADGSNEQANTNLDTANNENDPNYHSAADSDMAANDDLNADSDLAANDNLNADNDMAADDNNLNDDSGMAVDDNNLNDDSGMAADDNNLNDDSGMAVDDNNLNDDNDMAADDTATQSQDRLAQNDTTAGEFKEGDRVRVSFDETSAELVALENNVMTVRTGDSVMQLPASELSQDVASNVSFSATLNGERQTMTLQEALDDNRELTVSQDWPSQLPQNAEAGVIVANEPGKLLVATVANNSIQLIQVPQSLQAGEAVALQENDGNIDVEPLDSDNQQVAFQDSEITGTMVSQNDDFLILESGQDHILLPASLEVSSTDENEQVAEGSEVKVVLPAGNAEKLAELDDSVVLETEHGVAHLPLDMLNTEQDSEMESVNLSDANEATIE